MTDTIYQAAANLQARLAALSNAYQPSGDNGSSGSGSDGGGSGSNGSGSTSNNVKKPNASSSNQPGHLYLQGGNSLTRRTIARFASGGYTGDWNSD
jgi:hypothetical protein